MACNSMINTVLATDTVVPDGGTIPVGNAVHGYGKAIVLNGNGIALRGSGYFTIFANFTFRPTEAENVTITALLDGAPITGAEFISPVVGANTPVSGSLQAVVLIPCACAGRKTLTFVTDNAATFSNVSVIAIKG